jgi:hypothetical protein
MVSKASFVAMSAQFNAGPVYTTQPASRKHEAGSEQFAGTKPVIEAVV